MKIQLDILYIILYSKNMFFFTDQQQQNKHEICRANSTLWKSLIISVFDTSLQKLYGMARNQFLNKNGIDCTEVGIDNGLTLSVMR